MSLIWEKKLWVITELWIRRREDPVQFEKTSPDILLRSPLGSISFFPSPFKNNCSVLWPTQFNKYSIYCVPITGLALCMALWGIPKHVHSQLTRSHALPLWLLWTWPSSWIIWVLPIFSDLLSDHALPSYLSSPLATMMTVWILCFSGSSSSPCPHKWFSLAL